MLLLAKLHSMRREDIVLFLVGWHYPKRNNIAKDKLYKQILSMPPPPKTKSRIVLQNICKNNGLSVKADIDDSIATIQEVGDAVCSSFKFVCNVSFLI